MPADRPESTDGAAPSPAYDALLGLLSELADLSRAGGRGDLAERLDTRREAVAAPSVCVVVTGDYKAGKSTLVNALVGAELCPVDDDVATVVPTWFRYADETTVVVRSDGPDGEAVETSIPAEDLADYVSEKGNPDNRRRVRTVEVGLPSPLLRDGIVLVDTPGVGGLGSEYTAATLASLSMAHAALFVSDATQEYTGPELEFLAIARERCPVVLPVLTKIDLFPDWVTVRTRDESWLGRTSAGDGDGDGERLVSISAHLALRAQRDARSDLHGESGLTVLTEHLRTLGDRGRARLAARAVTDVHAVTGQLAAPLRAEQDAIADPHATLAELTAAEDAARSLAGGMAEWVLLVDDGITDLQGDLDRELSERLLAVQREAERAVMKLDPGASWDEFEANLTRHTSAEVGAVAHLLVEGADRLAQRIAAHFAEHEAVAVPALSRAAPEPLAPRAIELDSEQEGGRPWRGELFEAGWGGVEAISVVASLVSIAALGPVSLVIGVLMGGKSLRQGRQRELEERRQRALEAVTRYLDDTRREAGRAGEVALRRVRRELRTGYQRRADALHRSARDALAAATRAIDADQPSRESRAAEVTTALERLHAFARRADDLGAALP